MPDVQADWPTELAPAWRKAKAALRKRERYLSNLLGVSVDGLRKKPQSRNPRRAPSVPAGGLSGGETGTDLEALVSSKNRAKAARGSGSDDPAVLRVPGRSEGSGVQPGP